MARESEGMASGLLRRPAVKAAPAALADTIVGDMMSDTILGAPPPSSALADEGIGSIAEQKAAPLAELQLLSALMCQELRIEGGAATAVRIADTFQVPNLPLVQPVAMLLRFRGTPGICEMSLQMEGEPHRLYTIRLEFAAGNSPCRTVLIPKLNITLSRAGEQRILIQARGRVIGSLPLYIKRMS